MNIPRLSEQRYLKIFIKADGSPVLLLPFRDSGHTLHQLLTKLVEDRLVKLQSGCAVEVQKGQRRLKRGQ